MPEKILCQRNESTPSFSEVPAFKASSNWTPCLNDTQSKLENEIFSIDEKGHNYPNLRKFEREALNDLLEDSGIVMKQAGKGSTIVVWDKVNYLRECEKKLSDTSIYKKIGNNSLPSTNSKIKASLQRMLKLKEIDKKLFNSFYIKHPEFGRFYLPPKIHKRLANVPERSVIYYKNTSTKNISAYLYI